MTEKCTAQGQLVSVLFGNTGLLNIKFFPGSEQCSADAVCREAASAIAQRRDGRAKVSLDFFEDRPLQDVRVLVANLG